MTVITEFPLRECEDCENIDPDYEMETLYADGRVVEKIINVTCRNARVCEGLYSRLCADGERRGTDADH